MSVRSKQRRLLGAAIRDFRKAAGYTQEQLAERAGRSAIFISRVERGVESPSFDSLVKIANALGVPVRDLVTDI